ncbi:unnamed protein product [Hermetia illucens]|uniref:Glutaminyl-peptide cyclotransferase n=1 Tax=Hermetia illucens TaxID=343691 RepID=A0A7R8YRK0_HERIL|nr:glutaminyl-peptide cyclotransferase-like [Hermetia illucens]CAD7082941.1 unnamed protein product [Hermetia illucens]
MIGDSIFFVFLVTVLGYGARSQAPPPSAARQIAQLDNNDHLQYVLSNILKPRVVGTKGHDEVATFIASELKTLGFDVELDSFSAYTPVFRNLTFTNIVGTINSNAAEFVALACHYDSKYFPNDPGFVGATDSAVPCALMLNLAKVLMPYIQQIRGRNDFGLMLIFFDGEEAFQEWTQQDSVYGSKNLAAKWSNSLYQMPTTKQTIRNIDRIEVLILLDLIGAQSPRFRNYYMRTQALHNQLVGIERYLAKAGLLNTRGFMFYPRLEFSGVDDDHRPFYEQNVPILHIISTPFPKHWHTKYDDAEHLHWPTIKDFNRIFRVFLYQYITNREASFNLRSIPEYH